MLTNNKSRQGQTAIAANCTPVMIAFRTPRLSRSLRRSLISAALLLGSPAMQAQDVTTLPSLGDSTSGLISLQQERRLGSDWLRNMRAQAPTLDHPMLLEWFHDLVYRLVPQSGLQSTDLQLVVIDSPELNAFAVPGGIVGINYGLLLHAGDEDEIASVLAHELAHLSQRHFARQVEAAQKRDPVALATLLASIVLIATNNTDAGVAGIMSTQAAAVQDQLAYSRDFEREADRLGMTTLVRSGFDANAMTDMFTGMQAASRYRGSAPEFLLTHPLTAGRVADAADRATAYRSVDRSASLRFRTLKLLAEARYVLKESAISTLHQRLSNASNDKDADALRMTLAILASEADAQAVTSRTELTPLEQAQDWLDAISEPTLDSRWLSARLAAKQGDLTPLAQLMERYPHSLPVRVAYASALSAQSNNNAVAVWRALTKDFPQQPAYWEGLSQAAANQNEDLTARRALAEFHYASGRTQEAVQHMRAAARAARDAKDFQREAAFSERLRVLEDSLRQR